MLRKRVPGMLFCGLGLLGTWGCQSDPMRTLDAAAFVPPRLETKGAAPASEPIGAALASTATDTQFPAGDTPVIPIGEIPKKATVLPPLEPLVIPDIKPIEALQAPATNPSAAPQPVADATTQPDSSPAITASAVMTPQLRPGIVELPESHSQAVFQTLGGVLAIVNDTPIYADKVLARLDKELTAKARDMNAEDFEYFARGEILRQLHEMQEDELYFATAYNALNADDRKLAQAIAMHFRQKKVTAAGGSVEAAKRKSLDNGVEFEESLKQDYRRIVNHIYQEKRIDPLIQVTANDMREFYLINAGRLYCDKDKARFREIEIDPALHGGMQQAMDLIVHIREQAIHGGDFATLATDQNDNPLFKDRHGSPCAPGEWTMRNSFPNEALEAAVWKIEPGEITPVIQANDHLYLARLDEKHVGVTKSFDDPAVQDDIYNRIYQAQFNDLWKKSKDDSIAGGMIDTDANRFQLAVDMAMQKYAQHH